MFRIEDRMRLNNAKSKKHLFCFALHSAFTIFAAMKLSIVIPVYGVENTLARCIDSVLAQSYSDYELILVDDGSPDRSGAICDEYAARDSRIHVIHKSNGGQRLPRVPPYEPRDRRIHPPVRGLR